MKKLLLLTALSLTFGFANAQITPAEKLYALVKSGKKVVLFKGFGTEPFWDLYVMNKELLYVEDGIEFYESYKLLDQFDKSAHSQTLKYQTQNGDTHSLTIINEPTGDGMSDELHPYGVSLNGKKHGCGYAE